MDAACCVAPRASDWLDTGDLRGSPGDLVGSGAEMLHDNALGLDGSAKLPRDPASRHHLEDDVEGVQNDDVKARLVVEDAGRQPDPEDNVVERDDAAGDQERLDAAKDGEHRNEDKNLKVRLDEAAGDVDGERAHSHRSDRENIASGIGCGIAEEGKGWTGEQNKHHPGVTRRLL